MSLSKHALNTLIAGAFAVSMAAAAGAPAHAENDKEKCYGVVKAGHNDCGNAAKTHSCMGQATESGSGGEWIALPKGVCEKLVGGSLEPFEGTGAEDAGEQKEG